MNATGSIPATAAATGLTPAIAKHDISTLRFARSVEPRNQLDPTSTIDVYVYRKDESPLDNIETFQHHLFAVIKHVNETEYNTTVYTHQEFKDFMKSLDVSSISPIIAVMPATAAPTATPAATGGPATGGSGIHSNIL
jgi:hypothetical protein